MRRAKIRHFRLKKRGRYPAIIPGADADEVQGMAWKVEMQDHAERLAEYETRAYDVAACQILFVNKDGEGDRSQESVDGWTFVSSFCSREAQGCDHCSNRS